MLKYIALFIAVLMFPVRVASITDAEIDRAITISKAEAYVAPDNEIHYVYKDGNLTKRWSSKQKFWLGASIVTHLGDVLVTAVNVREGSGCQELNPLYGKNPSLGKLVAVRAVFLVGQAWFANYLVQKGGDPTNFLRLSTGVASAAVAWNLSQDCN